MAACAARYVGQGGRAAEAGFKSSAGAPGAGLAAAAAGEGGSAARSGGRAPARRGRAPQQQQPREGRQGCQNRLGPVCRGVSSVVVSRGRPRAPGPGAHGPHKAGAATPSECPHGAAPAPPERCIAAPSPWHRLSPAHLAQPPTGDRAGTPERRTLSCSAHLARDRLRPRPAPTQAAAWPDSAASVPPARHPMGVLWRMCSRMVRPAPPCRSGTRQRHRAQHTVLHDQPCRLARARSAPPTSPSMWPTSPCSGDAHAARGGPAALQRPPRARRRLLQGGRASYQADVCGWISSRGRPARRRACRAAERVDHGRRSASPSWCVGELPERQGGHGGGISGAGGRGREGRASELRSDGEGAHTAPHGRLTSWYRVGNGPTAHGCRRSELVPLARPPARRSCEAGRQSSAASRGLGSEQTPHSRAPG